MNVIWKRCHFRFDLHANKKESYLGVNFFSEKSSLPSLTPNVLRSKLKSKMNHDVTFLFASRTW